MRILILYTSDMEDLVNDFANEISECADELVDFSAAEENFDVSVTDILVDRIGAQLKDCEVIAFLDGYGCANTFSRFCTVCNRLYVPWIYSSKCSEIIKYMKPAVNFHLAFSIEAVRRFNTLKTLGSN